MIIVRVFGGLGNQIFQYAFYKCMKFYNKDVYLDISDYGIHKHHNGFELDKVFKIKFDKATNKEIRKVSFDKKSLLYRLIRKIFKVELVKRSEYAEMKDVCDVKIGNMEQEVYFNGFWQDIKYVEFIENELRKELIFNEKLSGKNKDVIDKFIGRETVSIHIRRGDYLNNKSLGGICNNEYYLNAIEYINKVIERPVFFIFSDDMEWVKNNFKLKSECIYVYWNKDEESYKDMQLMSMCKHNIIANSTFSWWGAWLNMNRNKIVICPQKWFNNQNSNLQINNWISF